MPADQSPAPDNPSHRIPLRLQRDEDTQARIVKAPGGNGFGHTPYEPIRDNDQYFLKGPNSSFLFCIQKSINESKHLNFLQLHTIYQRNTRVYTIGALQCCG